MASNDNIDRKPPPFINWLLIQSTVLVGTFAILFKIDWNLLFRVSVVSAALGFIVGMAFGFVFRQKYPNTIFACVVWLCMSLGSLTISSLLIERIGVAITSGALVFLSIILLFCIGSKIEEENSWAKPMLWVSPKDRAQVTLQITPMPILTEIQRQPPPEEPQSEPPKDLTS